MSNSGQLRTLALNENRIRSDSDPTAGRMKSISRAGSIDTGRKKTQRQASITQFIYKDPKLNLENACSTPEKHVSMNKVIKASSSGKKKVGRQILSPDFVARIYIIITVNSIFRPRAIKKWTKRFKLATIWTIISVKMNQMRNIGKNSLKKEKRLSTIHSKKIAPFVNSSKEMIELYIFFFISLKILQK